MVTMHFEQKGRDFPYKSRTFLLVIKKMVQFNWKSSPPPDNKSYVEYVYK